MYVVFNDISTKFCAEVFDDHYEARNCISDFVTLLRNIKKMPNFKKFFVTEDFYNLHFSGNDYTIHDWCRDQQVKHDYISSWMTLRDMHCELIDLKNFQNTIELDECSEVFLLDCSENKHSFIGGIIAFENSYPLVSVKSHEHWQQAELLGKRDYLDEEIEDIRSSDVQFENIHEAKQLSDIIDRYEEDSFAQISSAQDLWEKKESLFTNVILCDSVKNNLDLRPSKGHIDHVIKKLRMLDKYFSEYSGFFSHEDLKLGSRPESSYVENDPKLKNMRRFKLPNGENRYFMYHFDYPATFCGRIHFFPDDTEKKCYVGYIGPHLPTKKF